jgi:hypothetical protein
LTTIPGSDGLVGPDWSPDGRYISAMSTDSKKLVAYDVANQKWSDWIEESAAVGYNHWSRDSKYVYFDAVDKDHRTFRRARVGQRRSEFLVDLKDLRQLQTEFSEWSGISPDNTPLFVRDLSTDEIYALDVELP